MKFVNVTRDPAGATGTVNLRADVFMIVGILMLLAGSIMTVVLVIERIYEPIAGAAVFIVAGAIFIVVGTVGKPLIKKWIEEQELVRTKTCAVTFSEDRFEVTCYANRKNNGSFSYDELTVTDYPTAWVLEYGEKRWVNLRKCNMTEGTWEELSAFLRERLKERYHENKNEMGAFSDLVLRDSSFRSE